MRRILRKFAQLQYSCGGFLVDRMVAWHELLYTGEVLADNAVGTDAAREAKIEETLRKLGLQGVKEVKGQAGEKKPMGSENSSVLDVSAAGRSRRPILAEPK